MKIFFLDIFKGFLYGAMFLLIAWFIQQILKMI